MNKEVLDNIKWHIEKFGIRTNIDIFNDGFEIIRLINLENHNEALKESEWLKNEVLKQIGRRKKDNGAMLELYKKILFFEAEDKFDSYLLAMEFDREPEKRFYAPRRNVLKILVDDLQDLSDGKIKFLNISMPPRTGKSTLGCFFITWLMGKYPDKANVMSGHSDKLTKGFYKEVISIITDTEYHWKDIFQNCKVASLNSADETVDINKKRRFSTLTCRSIGGTLTGAVEVGLCLYCDDMIEDLEEALNPERLDNKYNAYANQLKDRMKKDAFQLMIGTRWAVNDVQGRIEQQYIDNPMYRFRTIPALNEKNESNFDYPYNLGFDTEYYMDMKDSIDDATWSAKYMGVPYDRDGVMFPADELNYYNGTLPGDNPDKIIACCDVAWGGGDNLSMPIAYVYGERVYIHDVVFNNGNKEITQPIVTGKIIKNGVNIARFEANAGGDEYANTIDEMLRNEGYVCNINYRRTNVTDKSKRTRIVQYAPEIMRYYYIDDKYATPEYRKFMRELCLYTITGKNKNDDAADSMAQLTKVLTEGIGKVTIFERPF